MIRIVCKRTEGFYRGGRKHPAGLTEYPDGTFTPEQLVLIQNEPVLQVEIVPDPVNPPPAGNEPLADGQSPSPASPPIKTAGAKKPDIGGEPGAKKRS